MTSRYFATVSLVVILLTGASFPPAAQASADAPNVTVRVHTTPKPAEARADRRRIEAAALEVCGASPTSLREQQLAVRESDCYRKALDGALRQVVNPAIANR
jgi:UrcA family protein